MKNKPGWSGVVNQASHGNETSATRKGPSSEAKTSVVQGEKALLAFGNVTESASVLDSANTPAQPSGPSVSGHKNRPEPAQDLVVLIAANPIENDGLRVERYQIFPVDYIAYAFRGSVAMAPEAKKRLVDAPRIRHMTLDSEGVYVRTVRNEIFLTRQKSIEGMLRRLHPAWFLKVNRGLFINFRRLNEIDLNSNRVGFHIAGGSEWLRASTSSVKSLRHKLLLPQRLLVTVNVADGLSS